MQALSDVLQWPYTFQQTPVYIIVSLGTEIVVHWPCNKFWEYSLVTEVTDLLHVGLYLIIGAWAWYKDGKQA